MKNFDLEAAKRGAAACTGAGHPARIVAYDGKWLDCYILIVLVDYGGREVSRNYRLCGSAYADGGTDSDLMMRDDDYLEKPERGECQSGRIRPLYENASNSMPFNLTKREWFAGVAMAGEMSDSLPEITVSMGRNLCWRLLLKMPSCSPMP